MARGRPPKPANILKAQGSFREDRHSHREHTAVSGTAPVQPSWLKGEAAKFWKRNVPRLVTMGVVDGVDEATLTALATAWANWRKEQSAYDDGSGHIYKVACAWNCFDKIAAKFGFSPGDRIKLSVAPPEDEEDGFTAWLRRKNEHVRGVS